YFGASPRVKASRQFDRAFQIRTVRVLWAEIDNVTPEEAGQRCEAAGLPHPSATNQCGRRLQLYWFLDEPYRIDDVDDPLAVQTEFIDRGPGKKKRPRPYIVDPATKKK